MFVLDPIENFSEVEVSTGYNASDTTIVLASGERAKLPDVDVDGASNGVWYNSSDYPNIIDDPNKEIVRRTDNDGTNGIVILRAQEDTSAVTHNEVDKTYKIAFGVTKKSYNDIDTNLVKLADSLDVDEEFIETPNGIITEFSTVNTFSKITVTKNGTTLTETNDYTIDSDSHGITFVTAPATDTILRYWAIRKDLVAIGDSGRIYDEEPTGLVNGTNKAYDTAHTFIAGAIDVYLNNVHQTPTGDYVETDTDTITFVTAPQTGDTLRVYYDRYLPSAGNASQLDGNTLLEVMSLLNPVGTIREFNVSTNPGTLLGFGTWELHGVGKTTVCIDSGDTDFDTVDETRGSKTHTLTEAELASHSHGAPPTGSFVTTGTSAPAVATGTGGTNRTYNSSTGSVGSSGAHNNIQPSIVTYRWVRTV